MYFFYIFKADDILLKIVKLTKQTAERVAKFIEPITTYTSTLSRIGTAPIHNDVVLLLFVIVA